MEKRLSIKVDCNEDAIGRLIPYSVEISEGISSPFSATLTMLSERPADSQALGAALGKPATISLTDGKARRRFRGVITAHRFHGIAYRESGKSGQRDACCYTITVESALSLLRHQLHTRSFVRQGVVAVIKSILQDYGIALCAKDRLIEEGDFPDSHVYTQILESDYDFICRLCLLNGLNLVEDTMDDELCGQIFISDASRSYLTYLEAREGRMGAPVPGEHRCQMHDPRGDGYISEVRSGGHYRPPRDKAFTHYGDSDHEDFSTSSLFTCYAYYETIKKSGSDDLEFVDMSDEARTQQSVRECLAPRAEWSFRTTDLGARAGYIATLAGFYGDSGRDLDLLVERTRLAYNVNYPEDFVLHPMIKEIEASVEATTDCAALSLEGRPDRLPTLGDAGDPMRLMPPGRALTLEGSVCDAEGRLDRFGEAVPCKFDPPQDPSFFYMLPRGSMTPVVVRNSAREGGEALGSFPHVGDHVLVAALGGRLHLMAYHPVLGQLAYLDSAGMGTFNWLEGARARGFGPLTSSDRPADPVQAITLAIIGNDMESYIDTFRFTHRAVTARQVYDAYIKAGCERLRQDYLTALSEYQGLKHNLIGKFNGLSLTGSERESYERARKKLIAAHEAIERKAEDLKKNMFDQYEPGDSYGAEDYI
ncbi:MAG: phage late control D family protein [Succinivibrionaceae bacterium]|nr:phage late control D family protein [Succinivibrionaceae bacterium]